jgi:hypothetical protein
LHEAGPGAGDEYLEGAWRLTGSLRTGPSTSARLNAVFQDRKLLGALRAGGAPSGEWTTRLAGLDDPQGLLGTQAVTTRSLLQDVRGPRTTARGLYLEGNYSLALLGERQESVPGALFLRLSGEPVSMSNMSDAAAAERARAGQPFYKWLQGPLERPYLGLCGADYATAMARAYSQTLAKADRCAPVPESDDPNVPFAPWNVLGGGSLDRLAHSSAELGAEIELTRIVLRAREQRAKGPDRRWPRELPDLASSACAGRRWTYALDASGRPEVRLEGNPFTEQEATTRYRMDEP